MFLGLSFGLVYLLRMAQIGTLLAFLVVGTIVGPYALDLFHATSAWDFLSQLGIAFLWFIMGLELNVKRIWSMRKNLFGFGGTQVALVVLLAAPMLYMLSGWTALAAIMAAMLLAMSSTGGDLQILADKNELQSPLGRQSFSILLFQNLLSIPLLAMLPLFVGSSLNLGGDIVDIIVMSAGLVIGAVTIGRLVLNPIMRAASKLRSREAFILIILLNITLWSVVMDALNLPAAMGAFLAGMLMSETLYRHQVQADIAPYQIMFLSLFFITLGMNMNLPLLGANWWIIAAGVVLYMGLKGAVLYAVGRARGNTNKESFRIALLLSQGGEFGLLILNTILTSQLEVIPRAHAEIMMGIIVISMMLTPMLIKLYDAASRDGLLFRAAGKRAQDELADVIPARPSVVICGFGRVGQTVAKMFSSQNIPYIAVDMDVDQVVLGRREGYNVFYGDSTREDVLKSLGLGHAKVCVLALDNMAVVKRTVRAMKATSPRVKIFARSRNLMEADSLMKQGVSVALPETIESSLVLGQEALLKLGVSEDEVSRAIDDLRRDSYAALADILERNDPNYFKRNAKHIRELQHLLLKGEFPVRKKTLDETIAKK
ncbi:MAG: cation:proton antiporter [Rickettsiales bacterium]|nr:cation:proton antiporter [Rickettsiales bacterium]